MKKTVLITGASSGIGKSMAYKLASKGHNLIIVARRKELLKEIRNDIEAKHSVDIIINDKDLTHEASVMELYEEIKSYEVNVLINNAGFGD
jgi:short-subunit dehydrogenase